MSPTAPIDSSCSQVPKEVIYEVSSPSAWTLDIREEIEVLVLRMRELMLVILVLVIVGRRL